MTRLMKWLAGGLAVSLAVNLFFAGFIAARSMMPDRHIAERQLPAFNLRRYAGALPEKAQADLRQKFRKEKHQLATYYQDIRNAREELRALLTAEHLDEAAIRGKFTEIRAMETAMEERVQTLIVANLKNLDPEARKKAVGRYHRSMRSRRGR